MLGTENGDVLIVFNGDLRGNISVEPDMAIKAIVPTSKACPRPGITPPWTRLHTMLILTCLTRHVLPTRHICV